MPIANANKANPDYMMKSVISPLLQCRKTILNRIKPLNLLLFCTCTLLTISVATHPGHRRSVYFWSGMAPLVIEYKFLKYQRWFYTEWLEDEHDEGNGNEKKKNTNNKNWHDMRMERFHTRAAPRITSKMISMGGIYIKLGQLLSVMGGVIPKEYVESLQVLQDGLPPRDYKVISRIIEDSTGRKMEDMFHEFDAVPIGAASIGQAHRAILKMPAHTTTSARIDDEEDNGKNKNNNDRLEVIVKVQYPEVAQSFQTDFKNIDLAARFIELGDTEFLQATYNRHYSELDYLTEAANLREVQENMRRHGMEPNVVRIPSVRNETGICNGKVLVMEYLEGTSLKTAIEAEHNKLAKGLGQEDAVELKSKLRKRMREHFDRGGGVGGRKFKLIQALVTPTAKLIQFYGGIKQNIENAASSTKDVKGGIAKPPKRKKTESKINLSRILKTLVHIHGLQLLSDGVFNVDPHPGNVLILPDGRLGLLDYGMVGRFDDDERESAARLVLAISRKDKEKVAQIYNESGYRAYWNEGDFVDPNLLYRFASFHFDRLDLSDIFVGGSPKMLRKNDGGRAGKRKVEIMEILESARETHVPFWIENGRRLGALLIGVTNQALRPISLCKEWKGIATQVLSDKSKNNNIIK